MTVPDTDLYKAIDEAFPDPSPTPDVEVKAAIERVKAAISFRITRANHCDDVLTADGARVHINKDGWLFVWDGRGRSISPCGGYAPGDWSDVLLSTPKGSDEA